MLYELHVELLRQIIQQDRRGENMILFKYMWKSTPVNDIIREQLRGS